ncbi:citrate synthase-lysine N-methyltransferase CSKMT, mitochondrial [Cololabis saira]|uniref:citrate synthase-lysine N-methyltransferase CSKMT, mitochondrial n=1 Tax=Cololabis saira TaxID=129043 RepID=UPI002AD46387|nr:citrate synthase-lysine N-methyltransferase CSKMT, mitochondrial [Cololabis saira]
MQAAVKPQRRRRRRRRNIRKQAKMSLLSKSLFLSRKTLVSLVRRHSSLTAELINNMDKKATWDRFYAESPRTPSFKNFEWFFGFDSVRGFIMPLLQTASHPDSQLQVLDIGCGTSALGPSIYRHSDLPVCVTCADISPIAVQLMQEHVQVKALPPQNPSSRLQFIEMDCTQLDKHYLPHSLDLIVDKGTTDALLRSKEGQEKAALMLKQCLGVLRRSGSLLQFSDEDPDSRLLWLETLARHQGVMLADVGVQEIGELRGVCYYCYQVAPHPDV